jgi:hypothetical protein
LRTEGFSFEIPKTTIETACRRRSLARPLAAHT